MVWTLACFLLVSLLIPACRSSAAERICTVSVPVTAVLDHKPNTEVFTVKIEAQTPGAPMPEQKILNLASGIAGAFGPMRFDTPGDYRYLITQQEGSSQNILYDRTEKMLTVRVTHGADGMLTAELWVIQSGSDEKQAEILFRNTYSAPETETESETETETESETEIQTETETDDGKKETKPPKTGDETPMEFLMILMAAAVLVIGISGASLRRSGRS